MLGRGNYFACRLARCCVPGSVQFSSRAIKRSLVACNIYVSAGREKYLHQPILMNLLRQTQEMCATLSTVEKDRIYSTNEDADDDDDPGDDRGPSVGVLVHAYNDPVHNRSTFHLAGSPDVVAEVGSYLAVTAVTELRNLPDNDPATVSYNSVAQHPCIGLVDHVCTMPLQDGGHTLQFDESREDALAPPARVAKRIAKAMKDKLKVQVYLFGSVHRKERSLVELRKKHNRFFRILGGMLPPKDDTVKLLETVTVGSHDEFMENFNILMNRTCGKRRAHYLTRLVRELDGGLPHVEALNIPYSDGRFEISCNLLRPRDSSKRSDVKALIHQYIKECKVPPLVEKSYLVSTTALQCMETIKDVVESEKKRKNHDELVSKLFYDQFR